MCLTLEKLCFSVFLPHNSLESSLATFFNKSEGRIPCSDNFVITELPVSLPPQKTWGEHVL